MIQAALFLPETFFKMTGLRNPNPRNFVFFFFFCTYFRGNAWAMGFFIGYGYVRVRVLLLFRICLLNAFTTGNPFWGQIYAKLVWGGIWGL